MEDLDSMDDFNNGESGIDSSTESKAKKRVRKKSAKLIEMEESEAFEKKFFKSPPKGNVTGLSTSPKPGSLPSKKPRIKTEVDPGHGLASLAEVAAAELQAEVNKANGEHPAPEMFNTETQPLVAILNEPAASSTTKTPPVEPLKKPKPKKPKKRKEPSTSGENQQQPITDPTANYSLKQETESGLKLKLCFKSESDHLPAVKSDEEQPAIWPSLDEPPEQELVVKLKKKKKSKKNKALAEEDSAASQTAPVATATSLLSDTEDINVCDTKDTNKNDVKAGAEDSDSQLAGHLVIDTDALKKYKQKKGIKAKRKQQLDHRNVEGSSSAKNQSENSGVKPVNVYSNTAAMAMKLKTSSEKKASVNTVKIRVKKKFRRRGPTAYTMFSNNYRTKVLAENPNSDFAQISKRLGEIWQCLPAKEKMAWKRRAKQRVTHMQKQDVKGASLKIDGSQPTAISTDMVFTSKVPNLLKKPNMSFMTKHLNRFHKNQKKGKPIPVKEEPSTSVLGQLLTSHIPESHASTSSSDTSNSKKTEETASCNPIDVAAHLTLLGDSLHTIGCRLQEHRGPIAVQGSLSVLLDSSVCAMVSLMCLTNQIPELELLSNNSHTENLDNIAFIMPGIG